MEIFLFAIRAFGGFYLSAAGDLQHPPARLLVGDLVRVLLAGRQTILGSYISGVEIDLALAAVLNIISIKAAAFRDAAAVSFAAGDFIAAGSRGGRALSSIVVVSTFFSMITNLENILLVLVSAGCCYQLG